eukprot:8777637-Lingulodinium_polyedra.AAC.1
MDTTSPASRLPPLRGATRSATSKRRVSPTVRLALGRKPLAQQIPGTLGAPLGAPLGGRRKHTILKMAALAT